MGRFHVAVVMMGIFVLVVCLSQITSVLAASADDVLVVLDHYGEAWVVVPTSHIVAREGCGW